MEVSYKLPHQTQRSHFNLTVTCPGEHFHHKERCERYHQLYRATHYIGLYIIQDTKHRYFNQTIYFIGKEAIPYTDYTDIIQTMLSLCYCLLVFSIGLNSFGLVHTYLSPGQGFRKQTYWFALFWVCLLGYLLVLNHTQNLMIATSDGLTSHYKEITLRASGIELRNDTYSVARSGNIDTPIRTDIYYQFEPSEYYFTVHGIQPEPVWLTECYFDDQYQECLDMIEKGYGKPHDVPVYMSTQKDNTDIYLEKPGHYLKKHIVHIHHYFRYLMTFLVILVYFITVSLMVRDKIKSD